MASISIAIVSTKGTRNIGLQVPDAQAALDAVLDKLVEDGFVDDFTIGRR